MPHCRQLDCCWSNKIIYLYRPTGLTTSCVSYMSVIALGARLTSADTKLQYTRYSDVVITHHREAAEACHRQERHTAWRCLPRDLLSQFHVNMTNVSSLQTRQIDHAVATFTAAVKYEWQSKSVGIRRDACSQAVSLYGGDACYGAWGSNPRKF